MREKVGGWAERQSRPEVLARNNFHRGNEYFKEGTLGVSSLRFV